MRLRGLLLAVGLILFLGRATAVACPIAPHMLSEMPDTVVLVPGPTRQTGAWFDGPSTQYPHGVLGDTIEATRLAAYSGFAPTMCGYIHAEAGADHVFEDVAPRLIDLDADGIPEVIVVRSHLRKGAQLAIYKDTRDGQLTLIAHTPYIGQRNRWLAPIGAADLDGDGTMEIAYIDRPHLAKVLRVWRFHNGRLEHVADLEGFTNHSIGERDIAGGIRTCDGPPEMIVATADWARLGAVRYDGARFAVRDLGPHRGRPSFAEALRC